MRDKCSEPGCEKFIRRGNKSGLCVRHGTNRTCLLWYYRPENRDKIREYGRRRNERMRELRKDPEYRARTRERDKIFKRGRLGFTPEVEAAMFSEQAGRCAICLIELIYGGNGPPNTLQRDHCHICIKARGLLCKACNVGVGFYEKSQRGTGLVLAPYDAYLAKHSCL